MHTVIIGLSISTPTCCYPENFRYVDTSIILCSSNQWIFLEVGGGTSTLPSAVRTALRLFLVTIHSAVIKGWGQGISPGCYECGPWPLSLENRRKMEPKEIPSCLIPCQFFIPGNLKS